MNGLLGPGATLRRLRLRTGGGDALRTRLHVESALHTVEWTPAGLSPQAVLLVRRLALAPSAGAGLGSQVTRLLQTYASAARRPWVHADAAASDVVLFADEAELAACLVCDALKGRINTQWWWRSVLVGLTAQEWLRREVLSRGRLIVPVMELLASRSQAVAWAASWSRSDAVAGLEGLAQAYGWTPTRAHEDDARGVHETGARRTARSGAVARADALIDRDAVLTRVPELRSAGTLDAPAARLLAGSLLLSRDPSWLRTSDGGAASEVWVASQLRRDDWSDQPHQVPHAGSVGSSALRPDTIDRGQRSLTSSPTFAPAASEDGATPFADESERALGRDVAHVASHAPSARGPRLEAHDIPDTGPTSDSRDCHSASETASSDDHAEADAALSLATLDAPVATPSESVAESPTAIPRDEWPAHAEPTVRTVHTEFGGVFYLLNALLALELYGDFTAPRHVGVALSPWDLLALLGRTWFREDFVRDPVWELLASLAGRPADVEPGRHFVAPVEWRIDDAWLAPWPNAGAGRTVRNGRRLRVMHDAGFALVDTGAVRPRTRATRWTAALASYLQARLARALGVPSGIRARGIVCRQHARVRVTASAVDVYLSLDALPLPIRIAGLDRDAGWIPAAGRDIRFHFV